MEVDEDEERMKMTTIRIGGQPSCTRVLVYQLQGYKCPKLQFEFPNIELLFCDSFMATFISSHHDWNIIDQSGLEPALQEARKSYHEGGIPIGFVILPPDRETSTGFVVLGAGHNERIQKHSPTLHGEISAIEMQIGKIQKPTATRYWVSSHTSGPRCVIRSDQRVPV